MQQGKAERKGTPKRDGLGGLGARAGHSGGIDGLCVR